MGEFVEKLHTCPFCGEIARLDETKGVCWITYCPNDDCDIRPETGFQDTREEAIAAWNQCTPAASPVAPPESELDVEIARWQKAIYDLCRKESGDDTIDGGGCDSGDPLDFTLSEISEAFGIIKDKLASPVAGGSARIAEIESRLAAEMRKLPVPTLAYDCAYLLRVVTGELDQPQGDEAAEKIATLTKLNGEQLLLNNKLLFEVIPALQSRVEAALEVLRRPSGRGPMQFYNAQQVDELLAEAIAKLEDSAEGWVKVTPETMPPTDDLIETVDMRATFPSKTVELRSMNHTDLYVLREYHDEIPFTHWRLVKLPAPPAGEEERSSL